jgi:hypothetical protein
VRVSSSISPADYNVERRNIEMEVKRDDVETPK